LIDTLNNLLEDLRTEAKIKREQIVEAVIVGNTAMHHILAVYPCINSVTRLTWHPLASRWTSKPRPRLHLASAGPSTCAEHHRLVARIMSPC